MNKNNKERIPLFKSWTAWYWFVILFLVFLVIFVLMLMFADEWFWVPMPFMLTYLVKALDAM